MINIIHADLFTTDAQYIVHQANCRGIMGAGVAGQIRNRFPREYNKYRDYCKSHAPEDLLGTVLKTNNIIHLFGQNNIGRCTDIEAVDNAFNILSKWCSATAVNSIALPFGIGCGIGGANWNSQVFPIINKYFNNHKTDVYIYKLKG